MSKGIGVGHRQPTDIIMKPCDGARKSSDPLTIVRVQTLADMLSTGASRQTIVQFCCDNFGIGQRQAYDYYNAALRYMMPAEEDEFRKALLMTNINRLEKIIEDALTDKQRMVAIAAIKEMNNVLSPKNSVTIARNDKGEEIINITFD